METGNLILLAPTVALLIFTIFVMCKSAKEQIWDRDERSK